VPTDRSADNDLHFRTMKMMLARERIERPPFF
jgi:hypothetical protein